jgi:CubicO group peptidase (beta-lactamase class C family)
VDQIDSYVAGEMNRLKIPGLAVAVIQRGKLVTAKGFGLANVEQAVQVKPETVFQSGSVGKQFTAALVMLLVEDGKLSLDDSITRFYPDAPWRWRGITIRHLLTHTSGIPDYEETSIDLRKDYTEDEFARLAFGLKLEFEPGSRWSYSNTGYVLLGAIIRKATGQFYGDLLRDRLFKPLGMKTARIISEEEIIPNRAAGYRLVKGELKNQEWVSPSLNTTADGSLYLSILDVVAWDTGVRAKAVLRPGSWDAVFSPVKLQSGKTYPYGFGWFVDDFSGQRRHHHGGAWQGFKTYISRHLQTDLTVIVLANQAEIDPGAIAGGIAALIDPKLAAPTNPIADRDPAVTERFRRLLAAAGEGKLSPEELGHVRAGFFPGGAKAYEELLKTTGALMRLDLIETRDVGDDREFRYSAIFQKGSFGALLGLAPDGKVSAFGLWRRDPPP